MPQHRTALRLVILTSALVASLAGRSTSAAETGLDAVQQFNSAFITIMKTDDRDAGASRSQRLGERIKESFNLPTMMQQITGARWQSANEPDKERLTAAFLRTSIGNYLSRFETYAGEYFETTGRDTAADGTVLVKTVLVRPYRIDIPITYVAQQFGQDWQIVDMTVMGGLSENATRKAEFASILINGGIPGLTARLNEQADRMAARLPFPLEPGMITSASAQKTEPASSFRR